MDLDINLKRKIREGVRYMNTIVKELLTNKKARNAKKAKQLAVAENAFSPWS